MRLTTNSNFCGKLSDHCVLDRAFKCLLKKHLAILYRTPSSGAWPGSGPRPMNETKSSALKLSSFAGVGKDQNNSAKPKQNQAKKGGNGKTSENRIYFSVLKSHITEVEFPACLNILLVICPLWKPSKGNYRGFFMVKLCTMVVFLLFKMWVDSGGMAPSVFFVLEDLHLLRYRKKMQVVKNRPEAMCHSPKPLG